MAVFEIQGPDGGVYQVEAADESAAVAGFKQFSSQSAAPAEKPGMLETAARGIARGATFGLNDEAFGLMKGIGGLVSGEGFSPAYNRAVESYRARDKASQAANPITGIASEIAGGMGTGLGAMRAGATLIRGGMTLPQTVIASAAEGAGYGALQGAGNAEGGMSERLAGAQQGGVTGALVGVAVPLAARAIGAAATRAVTPMTIPPERQAMAAVLQREGVPLTAGQRTGSQGLKYAESMLGEAPLAGGGAARVVAEQGDAFTDAAMRRAGARGLATPENIDDAFVRLGQQFDDLSARNTLVADQQLGQDINNALQRYGRKLPSEQRALVGNEAVEIIQRIQQGNGRMAGADYQTIRSDLTTRANDASDNGYARALRGLRDALDNTMERSIRANRPDDLGAWAETRRQYGNLKDISKAAGGAGEGTASGRLTPQSLRTAIASGRNREAYARGQGDLAELVRAGNALMTPLPNSGTAQRMNILGLVGAGAGGAAGGFQGAAIGAALPAIAGRTINSNWAQRYLSNQAIGPATRRAIESHLRAAAQGGAQTQSDRLRLPSR
jgi:hypothetical protein